MTDGTLAKGYSMKSMDMSEAYEKAKNEYERIIEERDKNIGSQGACRKQIEEYEKSTEKNKPDGIAIRQKTIENTESDLNKVIRDMESAQINYNNMSGRNTEERGVSYISIFREERNQLTNVDAEETRNKLEEKQKVLENAFVTDFIAELSEKVDTAISGNVCGASGKNKKHRHLHRLNCKSR